MKNNIWIYVFVTGLTTYLIRLLPMTLFRKPITNPFIRSFLHYVPYVTLSVMTFPAIVQTANMPLAGLLSFGVGLFLAWMDVSMAVVAVACCATVFFAELFFY